MTPPMAKYLRFMLTSLLLDRYIKPFLYTVLHSFGKGKVLLYRFQLEIVFSKVVILMSKFPLVLYNNNMSVVRHR